MIKRPGGIQVAAGQVDLRHICQRSGLALFIAELLKKGEAFLIKRPGGIQVAAGHIDACQVMTDGRLNGGVVWVGVRVGGALRDDALQQT